MYNSREGDEDNKCKTNEKKLKFLKGFLNKSTMQTSINSSISRRKRRRGKKENGGETSQARHQGTTTHSLP